MGTWVRAVLLAAMAATGLAACAEGPLIRLDHDPFEEQNRANHAVTLAVDRAIVGPVARGYGAAVPAPLRRGIDNVVHNLQEPAHAIHYLLQGNPERAGASVARFGMNTVFGLGGLLDPATEAGIMRRRTGFDETFHRWGIPAGAYVELPLLGPGTERDWAGFALDIALDPVGYVLTPSQATVLRGLQLAELTSRRQQLDPVLRVLYYESADSYTALRISYLQNMRAQLDDDAVLEELEDLYADF